MKCNIKVKTRSIYIMETIVYIAKGETNYSFNILLHMMPLFSYVKTKELDVIWMQVELVDFKITSTLSKR
jgi:hypothetical protein